MFYLPNNSYVVFFAERTRAFVLFVINKMNVGEQLIGHYGNETNERLLYWKKTSILVDYEKNT